MEPYWQDDGVTLYHGDCREVLPALTERADLVLADPPYGETSLTWDRWPDGWLDSAALITSSLWCFGSLRMYLDRRDEFRRWKLSQDVVWEKHNGTGFAADRFRPVHEMAAHWYRGSWRTIYHQAPRLPYTGPDKHVRHRNVPRGPWYGQIGENDTYLDDGTRIARSVMKHKSVRAGDGGTEKPGGLLSLLIEYACPPGGLVVDPFSCSGSALDAARRTGRPAIGIELREEACEKAARRLSQGVLAMPP